MLQAFWWLSYAIKHLNLTVSQSNQNGSKWTEVHLLSRTSHPPPTTPPAIHRGKSLQPSYPFCLHLDRRWVSWINFTIYLVLKPLPSCFPFLSPSLSLPTSIKLWASYVFLQQLPNSFAPSTHPSHSSFLIYLPSCLQRSLCGNVTVSRACLKI